MLYIIYICLCYVYRSELKLRSVRTAIYGASLLCVALVSLVSDRRSRVVCPSRARDKVYLVSWDQGSGKERRVESLMVARVLMANGHRKWFAPLAIRAPENPAILRSLAEGQRGADGIMYSAVFSTENFRELVKRKRERIPVIGNWTVIKRRELRLRYVFIAAVSATN